MSSGLHPVQGQEHSTLAAAILSSSASSVANLGLIAYATLAFGAAGATGTVFGSLLAVAVAGPLSGLLSFHPRTLVLFTEGCKAGMLPIAVAAGVSDLTALASVAFLWHLAEGVGAAQRWHCLFSLFPRTEGRPAFLDRLQHGEAAVSVMVPLASGLVFAYGGGLHAIAVLSALLALLATALWRRLPANRITYLPARRDPWAGYRILSRTRGLILMNMARIVSGLAIPVWAIYLPLLLQHQFGARFPIAQGAISALSAAAMLTSGMALRRLAPALHDHPELSRRLALGALACMGSGFGLAAVFPGLVMPALLLIALAFGVFLPNIRSALITLGQRITPAESVGVVVAAGDSISRLAAAALSMLFGVLLNALAPGAGQAWLVFTCYLLAMSGVLMIPSLTGAPERRG